MTVKHMTHYEDYREALEQWRKNTPSTIHSLLDGTYTVEWETTCNSTTDLMREYLSDIKNDNDLPQEQIDALAFADSAIKTLIDMGVIK
jgi:hypothetical protein